MGPVDLRAGALSARPGLAMGEQHRRDRPPAAAGGTRGTWTPSIALLAIAVGIVAGALAWWWISEPEATVADAPTAKPIVPLAATALPRPPPLPEAAPAAPIAAPSSPLPPAAPAADPGVDPTPDISQYINKGERPTMPQVIERLHQAGVHSGLGAFSPPGTKPPLVGIAVPEDFVLPEGYVRHYQATDDGQRLEAVLMFAPDRPFFDASGRPIALPADRVVPPELAPPGLPIRRITIPAPTETGRPGR